MEKYVAIYSGSFNPPTHSHREIGIAVRDQLAPDEVWYMVSPQNPHKKSEGMTAFHHRIAMVRLNLAGVPHLVASDIEATISQHTGSTYSADTLRELFVRFPRTRFVWVIGADCFAVFHTWKDFNFILSNVPIVVVPRKGWTSKALAGPASKHPAMRRLNTPDELRTQQGWYLLDFSEDDVSASSARDLLHKGLCPQAIRQEVYTYALQNNLFSNT